MPIAYLDFSFSTSNCKVLLEELHHGDQLLFERLIDDLAKKPPTTFEDLRVYLYQKIGNWARVDLFITTFQDAFRTLIVDAPGPGAAFNQNDLSEGALGLLKELLSQVLDFPDGLVPAEILHDDTVVVNKRRAAWFGKLSHRGLCEIVEDPDTKNRFILFHPGVIPYAVYLGFSSNFIDAIK